MLTQYLSYYIKLYTVWGTIIILCKASINSDGQAFHHYQQNEHGMGQAHN